MNPPPDGSWRMSLTLLGIGGAFDADLGIANTGALLEVARGDAVTSRVLLDCGHTCGRQLNALGLTYADIDAVLLTHAHGDHIDGLEVLGYKSLFLYQQRRAVIATPDVMEMTWASLCPKMGRLQTDKGHSGPADMEVYFDPTVVEGEPVTLPGTEVTARFIPVVHVDQMPAYAILIDMTASGGPLIRWSGDCTFDAGSPLFEDIDAERGDLVFHDCIFYPYYEATVHTHFEHLAGLPEAVRERMVLIHHGKLEAPPALDGHPMHLGQPLERFDVLS